MNVDIVKISDGWVVSINSGDNRDVAGGFAGLVGEKYGPRERWFEKKDAVMKWVNEVMDELL